MSLVSATNLPFLKAISAFANKGIYQLSFVIYRRVWMTVAQELNHKRNGFLSCKSDKHEYSAKRNLFLVCPMQIYISVVYANLQTNSCFLPDFENESNQTILNRAYNNCEIFFFKSRLGECFLFRFLINQVMNSKHKANMFTCTNWLKILVSQVDDLLSDC